MEDELELEELLDELELVEPDEELEELVDELLEDELEEDELPLPPHATNSNSRLNNKE